MRVAESASRNAPEYVCVLLDRDRNIVISSADNSSESVETRANALVAACLIPRSGVDDALRSLDKGLPSVPSGSLSSPDGGARVGYSRRGINRCRWQSRAIPC